MVKVEWSKTANNDLIQIYSYIYENSTYYSTKTISEIIAKTDNLEKFPFMGRKTPEYNRENERELIYKSYRIIYGIKSDKIFIRRIWHSARKLPQKLIF